MNQKRRLRTLGRALAVALALSGVFASAAWGTEWAIEEQSLSKLGIAKEGIASIEAAMTLEVPGLGGIKIVCGSAKNSGSIIAPKTGELIVKLSSCVAKDKNGKPLTGCPVVEPIPANVVTELIKNEKTGAIYNVLRPEAGKPLMTVSFEGEVCALPKVNEVTGETAGEVEVASTVTKSLKFSEGIASAAKTTLKFGTNTAYLGGSLGQQLGGANAGKKWGVI